MEISAADPLQIVKLVADAGVVGVSDSYNRYLCFLLNQAGCGTFGVNEDDTWTKADQEKDKILNPLSDATLKAAKLLATRGDVSSMKSLVDAQVAACRAINNQMNAKFVELKSVKYEDPVRRNNIRGEIIRWGQNLVTWLKRTADFAGTAGFTPANSQQLLRTVNDMAVSALTESTRRRQCYLADAPGCGKIGVEANLLLPGISLIETESSAKAADELSKIVTPLTALCQSLAVKLADVGDSKSELALVNLQVQSCMDMANYINAKYAEFKSVIYNDWSRRNNIGKGEILGKGREMVACFQQIKPKTAEGRAALKNALQSALAQSKEREACFRAGASGCGRFGWDEDDSGPKGDQERDTIGKPIEALINGLSGLSGIGLAVEDRTGLSPWAWAGVGAAAILVGHAVMNQPSVTRNRRRRRSRRTSRRTSR